MRRLGFTFTEGAALNYDRQDDWQRDATGYRVTFTYDGRKLSTDFWQGSGIDHDPQAGDVMGCLVSDARLGDQSFRDFCADLGYDEDSRSAERTWKACQAMDGKLRRLFGVDYDEALCRDWEVARVD